LDGIHSANTHKGPIVDGCYIERTHDDGVAVHGCTSRIVGVNGNEVAITSLRANGIPQPGDTVSVLDPQSGLRGDARVLSRSGDDRLRLDQTHGAQNGWMLETRDRVGSGYRITRTTVFENRARGLLLKAHDGLVSDCVIVRSTISGICLAPEPKEWSESSYSRNCTVTRCIVDGTGYATAVGGDQPFAGAISITSVDGKDTRLAGHSNLRITDNVLRNIEGVQIFVANTKDSVISGNRTANEGGRVERGNMWANTAKSIVVAANCANVQVTGNAIAKI
jgi:hypothetical protein